MLVEFDPQVISYEDLCVEWSRMHTPIGKRKCQYRSAVWYLDDEQKETAEGIVEGMRALHGKEEVVTSVEPATRFYQAEDYHQNFIAKN